MKLPADAAFCANRAMPNDPPRISYRMVVAEDTTDLEYVLLRGADPNTATDSLVSPIQLAVHYNRQEAVEILLDRGCDLSEKPPVQLAWNLQLHWEHPVMKTAALPDTRILRIFLGHNLVPAESQLAVDLLGRMAKRCRGEAVELLLEHGVDPNARDAYGETALMSALGWARCSAACGTQDLDEGAVLRIVDALQRHRADPHATDDRGESVLSYTPAELHRPTWEKVRAILAPERPREWWRGVLYALSLSH